jgi:hypothetical protein
MERFGEAGYFREEGGGESGVPRSLKGGGDLTLCFDGGHCLELGVLIGMARGMVVVVVPEDDVAGQLLCHLNYFSKSHVIFGAPKAERPVYGGRFLLCPNNPSRCQQTIKTEIILLYESHKKAFDRLE